MKKKCWMCGEEKLLSEFYKRKGSKDGHAHVCKECNKERYKEWRKNNLERERENKRRWTKDNQERARENWRKWYEKNREDQAEKRKERRRENPDKETNLRLIRQYGITLDERRELQKKQNNKCAICGEKKKLHVDHDHITGRVIACLCGNCNKGLGCFHESKTLLKKATVYLEKHNKSSKRTVK